MKPGTAITPLPLSRQPFELSRGLFTMAMVLITYLVVRFGMGTTHWQGTTFGAFCGMAAHWFGTRSAYAVISSARRFDVEERLLALYYLPQEDNNVWLPRGPRWMHFTNETITFSESEYGLLLTGPVHILRLLRRRGVI